MDVTLKEWGNSQGIRIPKSIVKDMKLALDDVLDIYIEDGRIIIEKKVRHTTLEDRMEKYGKLENSGEYDYGEPRGRERW